MAWECECEWCGGKPARLTVLERVALGTYLIGGCLVMVAGIVAIVQWVFW